MNKSITNVALFFIALAVVQGCANDPYGTAKVSGTVTMDGAPIEGVNVSFVPTGSEGREGYGTTDTQGKFVLTVPGAEVGSGAIPGEYHVTFSKMSDPMADFDREMAGKDSDEIDREMKKRFPGGRPSGENLIPAKYADRNATDIAPVKVEKGKKNDFSFALSSQ